MSIRWLTNNAQGPQDTAVDRINVDLGSLYFHVLARFVRLFAVRVGTPIKRDGSEIVAFCPARPVAVPLDGQMLEGPVAHCMVLLSRGFWRCGTKRYDAHEATAIQFVVLYHHT